MFRLVSLGLLVSLLGLGLGWFLGSRDRDTTLDREGSAESARKSPADGTDSGGPEAERVDPVGVKAGGDDGRSPVAEGGTEEMAVEELLAKAQELLTAGDPAAAVSRLDKVSNPSDLEPRNRARYENLLGLIDQQQGNSEAAVSHFLSARQAAPGDVAVALNLAEALRSSGMVRLTEAALLDALELSPDGFLPNVRYRFFLIQTGRAKQVMEEVQNVPEEERMGMDVLAVVAGLHANAGSYDKVDRVLQRIRSETDDGTVSVLLSDPVFRKYVAARIADSAVAGVSDPPVAGVADPGRESD